MSWGRLIRFVGDDDAVHLGEPVISSASELESLVEQGKLYAKELSGNGPFDCTTPSGKEIHVKTLLGPLVPADVPIVRCIGLNYIKHIQEGGRKPPPYPSVFIKPSPSISGYGEDIPITKIVAEDGQLDYEGELCIVIGKTGKDIPKEKALEYIVGYASGNDVSSRRWQRDPAYAGGVPQWCFAKGFDKWCPIGPMLVSPKLVGAANNLSLRTWVNGELRQDSDTSDLLFGVPEIVAFASQGTTLEKGCVIMTGTPAGVAMGMKEPKWLKNGDLVEIEIGELGKLKNKMVYES